MRPFFLSLAFLFLKMAPAAAVDLSFSPNPVSVQNGQTFSLDVLADGYTNIIAFQFSINWGHAVLQGISVDNFATGLAPSDFNWIQANGQLAIAHLNSSGAVTLPPGSRLFSINFQAVGGTGAVSAINFSGTPTPVAFYNSNYQNLTVNTSPGSATIVSSPQSQNGIKLYADDAVACLGQTICVPVKVDSFAGVASAQFSVNWNPAFFGFQQVTNLGISTMSSQNFGLFQTGLGNLSFAWSDPTAGGISLPDGATLFDVCLSANGSPGSSSNFNFSNSPTFIEFADVFGLLPYHLSNAQLLIEPPCQNGQSCDLISASAAPTAAHDDGCCQILTLANTSPTPFPQFAVHVLDGGELLPPEPNAGWSLQSFDGSTTAIFAPVSGGNLPTGTFSPTNFCLENLYESTQTIEIQYFNESFQIACRDTLTINCTACVAAVQDSAYCNGWNNYEYKFCVKIGENVGWDADSLVLIPPPGYVFSPANFPLPSVEPGETYCFLTTSIGGNVQPGDSVCFTMVIHNSDGSCCSADDCFVVPACDPCLATFATSEPTVLAGDSCCFKITLHNPPAFFTGIATNLISPGSEFSAFQNLPGAGWFVTPSLPASIFWDAVPPQGNFIQNGHALGTVCFSNENVGQHILELAWLGQDSSWCRDTLLFNCTDEPNCLRIDPLNLSCEFADPGGQSTFSFTFQMTNTANPAIFADEFHLQVVGPGGTFSQIDFTGNFLPGSTTTHTVDIYGNAGDQFCFTAALHEVNDDNLHLNCCTSSDTVCMQLPPDGPPSIVCTGGLSLNLLPPAGSALLSATDLVQNISDACTDFADLDFAIRLSGTGTGFPVDGFGNPIPNITFYCTLLGIQNVEVWVRDAAGNANYCETYVIVNDPSTFCSPPEMAVWPNPASNLLNINFLDKKNGAAGIRPAGQLTVLDALGKSVFSEKFASAEGVVTQIGLQNLPAGAYCIFYKKENGEAVRQKFIIGK